MAPDIREVVQQAEEYAQDRDLSFGVAATEMAQYLDDVEASDIIDARNEQAEVTVHTSDS